MERLEEIALRKAEIKTLLESEEEVDVEAIRSELDSLEAEERKINEEVELAQRKADEEAEQRKKDAELIKENKIEVKEIELKESKMEVRNTKEYIDAYAEYVKTGKDAECRALLTENATNGTVPVPEFVYDIVKTAWEREGIMALVRKSYFKGNLKVGFEISGTDAVIHTEGGAAIDPETLVLGTVDIIAKNVKKAIQISREVYKLRGEAFLRYIYDELSYKIAKKTADNLVAKIIAAGTVSTTTAVGVAVMTANTVSQGTVASAMALLSDEAANPVLIMNKQTWGSFKAVQYAGNFDVDPFENLPVLYNNTMTAYSAASSGDTYVIVGDLGEGALANFPDGDDIDFLFDELTYKKSDLIEIMGERMVGVEVVAPGAFVKVVK
jgi:HK97 family phage major capsid protein